MSVTNGRARQWFNCTDGRPSAANPVVWRAGRDAEVPVVAAALRGVLAARDPGARAVAGRVAAHLAVPAGRDRRRGRARAAAGDRSATCAGPRGSAGIAGLSCRSGGSDKDQGTLLFLSTCRRARAASRKWFSRGVGVLVAIGTPACVSGIVGPVRTSLMHAARGRHGTELALAADGDGEYE